MADLDLEYDSSKFLIVAVNVLLQSINEQPISTDVELADIVEAQLAKSVIVETKKEILSEGWDFNTDDDYSFPQDSSGYINIPANILDISDTQGDVIMRDWRLYSKSNQSAIFEEPQSMRVIWDLDFNSITHPLRNFITVRAARKYQARNIMDTDIYQYTLKDEEDAHLIARRSEGFTASYNMLTSAYGTDNMVIA